MVPMQQQLPGTLHSGPYYIATAFHTAAGDDDGLLIFDRGKLGSHIAKWFEQEKLTSF